jgi:hypothetical protein
MSEPEATPAAELLHAGKFRLVYLLLVAGLVGMAGLALHTATGVKPAKKETKASWQPAGPTTLAVSRSIAKHYTGLKLKGFEPKGSPRVDARRAAELKISGLQIPFSSGTAQLSIPPSDVVYQICGQSKDCSFVAPPTTKRELLLRRLVLGIVLDTFSSPHAPKHAILSLPTALVFFAHDEFSDESLRKSRLLLARIEKARKPSASDIRLLYDLTNGRAFELADQVVTEDQKIVLAMKPRACMDAACPE